MRIKLDLSTPGFDQAVFDREIAKAGSGAAARAHLAAGGWIATCDADTPEGHVVITFANGERYEAVSEGDDYFAVAILPNHLIERR